MAARFSAVDYRDALLSLLPRGRVWPREPGSAQHQVMSGVAPTFERLDGRAQQLLFDAFPANTLELLPEWEATLGLPDPCEGEGQTIEQRRAQVVVKMFGGGGQSIPYFRSVLERLGYTNPEVTEYAPFRAGRSRAGDALLGEEWWYVWNIHLPDVRAFRFRAGESAAGDPLVTYSDESAACVIAAIKPAHTVVTYTYGE